MSDQSVLGQVVLGYSPMVDRHRAITAARLTVFPSRSDTTPDASALLEAVAEVWPADGGRVSLNVASETALQDLVRFRPAPNVMVEIPAFMACDVANTEALRAMHAHGSTLLIKGRPLSPLPREVLPCFAYSIIDLADERRDGSPPPGGVTRTIPHIQSGVRTLAEMEQSFQRGAIAVLGWPIDDVAANNGKTNSGKSGPRPELQFIVELINRVDREEPADRLEAVLKTDPTLAFRLMRYINSPAFGLSVEINSFRHAIMVLGYNRSEALVGAAARLGEQGSQRQAGDVCRGAPRPADGRVGWPGRQLRPAQRDVHLRRVLAARPLDGPAACPS